MSAENENDAAQLVGFLPIDLRTLSSEGRDLVASLAPMDPLDVASMFAGLLTVPELQSNCLRLELIVHATIAFAGAEKKATDRFVRETFSTLDRLCGLYEDPAEDVFVTSVSTRRGNCRVLEGTWESAGFFLERVVRVVEGLPAGPDFDEIKECVYSLLRLSDVMCERANLIRYTLGNPRPLEDLPSTITFKDIKARQRVVQFSEAELSAAGVSVDRLLRFAFDPDKRASLADEGIGHSALERYPLAFRNGTCFFILPTAATAAIRRFVFECLAMGEGRHAFIAGLALEYADLFSHTPLLGHRMGAPIEFRQTRNGFLAGAIATIDKGRYLNFVFFLDSLEDFAQSGLVGTNPDPVRLADDIDKWIDQAHRSVSEKKEFKAGLTVLVSCGIGRAFVSVLNNIKRPNWRVEFLSAPDLYTLSWVALFKPLSLWRMLDARDRLRSLGVELHNINGTLNLVAWIRSLDGHLVPHSQLPEDFGRDGSPSIVTINQNSIRELRYEVLAKSDPHVELDVKGRWIAVRKEGVSLFEEDEQRPLYVVWDEARDEGLYGVYVTSARSWWCEIGVAEAASGRFTYQRWQLVSLWLSRSVPVLEKVFGALREEPILWKVRFNGSAADLDRANDRQVSFKEAREDIEVSADQTRRTIETIAGSIFEQAHVNVANIAERALVDALVEGVALFAGRHLTSAKKDEVVQSIVRDDSARQHHAFRASEFRDFVHESLPQSPITLNDDDNAILKLGLGWSIRKRSDGSSIEGKAACTAYLNDLVRFLEDDLCADLRHFDRLATLQFALRNYEAAVVEREHWRRTAAAVLAVHDDKDATRAAMLQHESELNAVFVSTRTVVEVALCECSLDKGAEPGRLDLSRFMAKAAQIYHFGGWSDAIRWDAMEPRLRITPLGDVQANYQFIEGVVGAYSRQTHDARVVEAVSSYAKNLQDRVPRPTVESFFEPEFLCAWQEQVGAPLDQARAFVDFVEDLGVRAESAIIKVRRSAMLKPNVEDIEISEQSATAMLDFFTFVSRPSWRNIPDGYREKDIHPWRFRRRLSVLRKPILQVTDEEDPLLLIAPGMVRDALAYVVATYYRGDFPLWQLTKSMRAWAGKARDTQGKRFSREVAERLKELGWQAEVEVKVTKLLRRGFEQNYGDVDVLAWKRELDRVLIIECKDVQYRKTYGEISEQLADFRGERDEEGKPDHLLRHLNRVDLATRHLKEVAEFVQMPDLSKVESKLVFKNPVPVQFALKRMAERVVVFTFDMLDRI